MRKRIIKFLLSVSVVAMGFTILMQCCLTHDSRATSKIYINQNVFRYKLTDPLFNLVWSGTLPPDVAGGRMVEPIAPKINSSHSDVDMTSYKDVLTTHSDDRKWILLALADEGCIDTAVNFYITSLERHNINNYLIISSDNRTCNLLKPYKINCYMYLQDKDAGHPSVYHSKDFLRKMNIRTFMILDALRLGFNVLHSDLDVYFMKNPFEHFQYYLNATYDIAPLFDWSAYNAGFLFIQATEPSIAVYNKSCHIARTEPKTDDQIALNRAISSVRKKTTLAVLKLSENQFQCGKKYWGGDGNKHNFTHDCPECIVVHNNWVVSMEAKRYRFRESGLWEVDINGYYSDPHAKYLTFDNEVILTLEDSFKEEMNALQNAFAIGQILNRTVIFPKFHCKDKRCTLLNHLKIRKIEAQFPNYRESAFLENPLVPKSIKLSKSETLIIATSTYVEISERDIRDEKFDVSVYTAMDNKNGADSNEIKKWFGDEKASILQFDNLYGAFAGFTDESVQSKFQQKVKDGFVKGKYLQF